MADLTASTNEVPAVVMENPASGSSRSGDSGSARPPGIGRRDRVDPRLPLLSARDQIPAQVLPSPNLPHGRRKRHGLHYVTVGLEESVPPSVLAEHATHVLLTCDFKNL